ncbi:MAG: nitroreductase family protein [Bacteroidales bacterium]|nr:nitroreductase family protein [Bacteroidales bacterium]
MIKELAIKSRSYRRFFEEKPVDKEVLTQLVELARYCPSARNVQPLKFITSCNGDLNAKIFPLLAWAGYLKDWNGPEPGERPSAYIIMLEDSDIATSSLWDQGIVSQTMLLAATEMGLGGCIIGSVRKEPMAELLQLPANLKITLVIALGYPKEQVQIDPLPQNGSIHYWRDGNQTHHVPKRDLKELLVKSY